MEVICFTDGACPSNGRGSKCSGYGVYFPNSEYPNISMRCPPPHTNNRAELSGFLHVLRLALSIDETTRFKAYCDSEYVVKIYNNYMFNWARSGWTVKKANLDLVREIYEHKLALRDRVEIIHCRAHTKSKDFISLGNKEADLLAVSSCNGRS